MIKVFLFDYKFSDLSDYFGEEQYNIPFLNSTMFDFFTSMYRRFGAMINQEVCFYLPKSWPQEIPGERYQESISSYLSTDDRDLVFLTTLFSLPIFEFSKDDYHNVIQNSGKLFPLNVSGTKNLYNIYCGYLSSNDDLSKTHINDSSTNISFSNIINMSLDNYLRVNQSLSNNFSGNKSSSNYYGLPVDESNKNNIHNSKLCAPCFVGEEVELFNSVVYPGTVLTGKCVIHNSEVFESFVCESVIKNSTIKNSLITSSKVESIDLIDSVLQRGSVIVNGRKK